MIAIGKTHIGLVRQANEDAILCLEEEGLFVVADGMGGHKGGQTASQGAIHVIQEALPGRTPSPRQAEWAVQAANRRLFDMASQDESLEGMGTTVTLLWKEPECMIVAHVGDSRCYLWREGELRQMTDDHSLVAQMMAEGLIDAEQARNHPYKNVITRAVGTSHGVEVDTVAHPRRKGDVWLLCSDGLHGLVSDEQMTDILKNNAPEEAAQLLMDTALAGGGRDNISLILVVDEEGCQ